MGAALRFQSRSQNFGTYNFFSFDNLERLKRKKALMLDALIRTLFFSGVFPVSRSCVVLSRGTQQQVRFMHDAPSSFNIASKLRVHHKTECWWASYSRVENCHPSIGVSRKLSGAKIVSLLGCHSGAMPRCFPQCLKFDIATPPPPFTDVVCKAQSLELGPKIPFP